ncbi:MAG: hypothetical protein CXT73_00955 [Methanobacteriota archaeon]|jgi:hypothetical protein|nr:MAG: hypothetical protein CXT73_00955 [Euryarchaeota archaeon]
MLHSKIQFNPDIAENVRAFNPFGPNMLYMSLNNNTIQEVLKVVNDLSNQQDIKDKLNAEGQIIQGTKAEENQKNSIVDGEMYPIPPEFQEKKYNNVINELLTNLTLTFGQIINSHVEDDIALRSDLDAIENIRKQGNELIPQVNDVWYVKLKAGDFHILHEHSNSGATVSGAIYLDVPDVPYPQGTINWIPPGSGDTMYNGSWGIQPKNGDVFMWPSWLLHTVFPFRGEGVRTMISFNSVLLTKKGDKIK